MFGITAKSCLSGSIKVMEKILSLFSSHIQPIYQRVVIRIDMPQKKPLRGMLQVVKLDKGEQCRRAVLFQGMGYETRDKECDVSGDRGQGVEGIPRG